MLPRHSLRLAAVVLMAFSAGCSRKPPVDEIRMQLSADPVSLDPSLAEDGLSLRLLPNLMEGLVGYDARGNLEKRLAESWVVSKDGLRWSFTLRPDVRWSDGRPVRAEDFVVGLRRSLDPGTGAKLAEVFSPVRKDARGIYAEDGKLLIELERRAPYLLQALALSLADPQREDVLSANGGRWPESAPVTGPYRLAAYRISREIIFEPNPLYWRPGHRTRVRVIIVQDEATARNLFDQNRIDILTRFPSEDFPRLKKQGVLRVDPFFATYYLSFNIRKPPFDRIEWRQAVAGAIRRTEIVQALDTGERAASSWIPPELEGGWPYRDDAPRFADAVSRVAREIRSGAAIPPVELGFDSGGRNAMLMEKVQADLQKSLGLHVRLDNSDWKTYVSGLSSDAPQIYRFGWLAPFRDPLLHLQAFVSGNPNNYTGWSNARYDRLVTEISGMGSGPERAGKIRQAENILLYDAAVVIPLYHYVQVHAVSPRVAGFRVNPFGFSPFQDWSVGP